ncbi:hypothetical protein [Microbacterium capsulatum]|uniref:Uncharacterized protein n=1 Tax=Microbacterium capsulatum TaxID=3041921 RepID=A0ABU0XFR3_9MICO|nr:hypothetical protein [Microbacterium sp. ASV81]MDQ4213962.1 hypothetical protein [Microbacterium sp. ASV81]
MVEFCFIESSAPRPTMQAMVQGKAAMDFGYEVFHPDVDVVADF